MQKREKKRALLIELVEIELMYLLRRVDVEIDAGEGSIYHTFRRDIDWHWTSLYDQLSVSDSYLTILFTSLSITRYIHINIHIHINIYTYTHPTKWQTQQRPQKTQRKYLFFSHRLLKLFFPRNPPKRVHINRNKKSKNPTGAPGALTGKDSAVGGLTGGRKPGPANNRSDDDENTVNILPLLLFLLPTRKAAAAATAASSNPVNKKQGMLTSFSFSFLYKYCSPSTEREKKDEENSSLKIRIQLDLDVEIHLTARVKGDITIGLL